VNHTTVLRAGKSRFNAPGLAVWGLALACLTPAWSASALLEGCRWLRDGRPGLAAQHFQAALASDSECAEALVGRGIVGLLAGRIGEAAEDFEMAAALQPRLPSAQLGIGAARCLAGDFSGALQAYRYVMALPLEDRESVQAAIAYALCAAGLYTSAQQQAGSVLRRQPHNALAAYVLAAASLAGGQPLQGLSALDSAPSPAAEELGVVVPSCVFSPPARYWVQQGLGKAAEVAVTAPPPSPPSAGAVTILNPAGGAAVRGTIRVTVRVSPTLELAYVTVLLADRFCGISNVQPYAIIVNTLQVPDGVHQLTVNAYSASGTVVGSASVEIHVDNGHRTLAVAERAARRAADRFLQRALALRLPPAAYAHLRGRLLDALSQPQAALAAYEYAFSYSPALPLLRADLLRAYRRAGLSIPLSRPELYRLPPSGKYVALTFDDGPHPQVTPWILNLLDRYSAHATFFLVGKQVDQYPELAAQIASRGHELACHSYTHRDLQGLDELEVERELVRTRAAIHRACGIRVTKFRPPGGHYSDIVRRAAATLGFTTVFWNCNICNYTTDDPQAVARGMLEDISSGSIVLLHNGEDITTKVLPLLLPGLAKEGLAMVSLKQAEGGGR